MNRKNTITLVCMIMLIAAALVASAMAAGAGASVGKNLIPLSRDKATAPYAVFQQWTSKKCFDDADNTVKLSATYASCAIRFEQDAVTKVWFLTVPADLPSGEYLVIIRDGADGAEANTDTDVAAPMVSWDSSTSSMLVVQSDVFVSY